MAQYTGNQSTFKAALDDYANIGFFLTEPNDHELQLFFKDKLVATFNQTEATIEAIRASCKNYLSSILKGYDYDSRS